ncbi:MAG: VIT domain-containing protein [Candidatus Eremiobacteraeota bacterium]|nr:VIT domain-containing protein [Candidatus Eremiobacteraeota bacterium]
MKVNSALKLWISLFVVIFFFAMACTRTAKAPVAQTRPDSQVSQVSDDEPPAPDVTRPPAMVVKGQDEKPEELGIARVEIKTRIYGYFAETEMTLVFSNPHSRPMAGDLYFPLPEGATVSGYALDVKGRMVEGVAVSKEKGRQVFEKEVRKGIDPGLMELAKGNTFKTRVFPIPPGGSRTVRVSYVSDIVTGKDGASYRLPLNFAKKLSEFSMRVEVVKGAAAPVVKSGGPANLAFSRWNDSYVAEAKLKDSPAEGLISIALPEVEKTPVIVEDGGDGFYYFAVNDFPSPAGVAERSPAPRRVALYWDASGSREKADHKKELALLEAFFSQYRNDPVIVDLLVFRNAMAPPQSFEVRNGDAGGLLKAISGLAYDGGTQTGCLAAPPRDPDVALLFTDGISNFGSEVPSGLKKPLYVFSSDLSANYGFLKFLALSSGGAFFNLERRAPSEIVGEIGKKPFSYLGSPEEPECYPATAQPVQGRFTLLGRFSGAGAKVALRYGRAGMTEKESSYTIDTKNAPSGQLLRCCWAEKKVEDLSIFQEKNAQEIESVGKEFSLVTPFTSLIVLESIEQYMDHAIRPPAGLADYREQYDRAMKEKKAAKVKDDESKIERIVKLWDDRVSWWEKKYSYKKDFKYYNGEQQRERHQAPAEPMRNSAAPQATTAAPRTSAADGFGSGGERDEAMSKTEAGADKKQSGGKGESPAGPEIIIKEWNPETPYLTALSQAGKEDPFSVYIKEKKKYGASPAFYLDCAQYMLKKKQEGIAIQILSNIAELELESAPLLRVLAQRLLQLEKYDLAIPLLEEAKRLRPEEPQSYRDLALALAKRARSTGDAKEYEKSMELLNHVVINTWDRFEEIEVIALMDLNAIRAEYLRRTSGATAQYPSDKRLVKLLDLDIRILLTWDADLTDMDLHLIEPSGEEASYNHNRTTIGGLVSRDFTQGYGPEEYCLRRAEKGTYKVDVNYYGSSAPSLMGPVTVQAEVITSFGRPEEKRRNLTLRLAEGKETQRVGEITF